MHITGFVYRPKVDEATGKEYTEIFMITCVDVGGWVPSVLVNSCSASVPRQQFAAQEAAAIIY